MHLRKEIGRASCRERVWIGVGAGASRRRHTRSYGDWSSDVCSSDLPGCAWLCLRFLLARYFVGAVRPESPSGARRGLVRRQTALFLAKPEGLPPWQPPGRTRCICARRSEERRVGKECGSEWVPEQAEDGIRDRTVTGVQTCALPIFLAARGCACGFCLLGTLLVQCGRSRRPARGAASCAGKRLYFLRNLKACLPGSRQEERDAFAQGDRKSVV